MRKQTKIAAVVSAAALLALGASITSFAASKGTWMLVDGEWYCYDKNGDVYENTFCSSNGKEYYVGDDGMIVKSDWVEYDGSYYFVNSSGAKITNDWRLTTPYDDEDAEEAWYYFQSTGKRAENKKIVYKGKTYFFDAEGKMLTGWVTADGTQVINEENSIDSSNTYYCGEDGARIEGNWIYTTEPTAEDDEADADEYYYYLKPGSGNPVVDKKRNNVKGQSYIFDAQGRMLWGWVAKTASGSGAYEKIDEEEDTDTELQPGDEVYYCSGEDDGHVKKNRWIKTWRPKDTYEEDEDEDKFWYWIEKDGKVYIPGAVASGSNAKAFKYALEEGKLVIKNGGEPYTVTKKKISSKDYFFNENGEMLNNFLQVTTGNADLAVGMYYFGGSDDGSMKTGSQTVKDDNGDSYKFYFGTRTATKDLEVKGVGITGNKSNKLYYHGMLIKAEDYKYQLVNVDDVFYIVNQNGSIQHSKSEYKEDGDVLVNAKEATFVSTNADIETAGGTPFKYSVTGVTANNAETIIAADVVYDYVGNATNLPSLGTK